MTRIEDVSIRIILSALYLFTAWFPIRHYIHMFQLNSYKPKVQLKWLKTNNHFWLIFPVALLEVYLCVNKNPANLGLHRSIIFYTVILAMTVYSIAVHFPKKNYKISLKYTARIKRLIVTTAIIYLLPALLNISVFGPLSPPILSIIYIAFIIAAPFVILLANLINRPVEQAINRHYINDAKRILKECPNLKIIGITGSFGKTSVKYFLDELLSVKYNVLKTPGNFNTPLGVVKTVRGELRATHDIFLCEMGAKNVGDIKEICDIVHPHDGIITSIGPMHLESFKTLENVKKTKFELAEALPPDGRLYLNLDDENVRDMSAGRNYIAYGIDSREGYYAENISVSEAGSEFDVVSLSGERCHYKTKLIGKHNVINICGAIACANTMGIPLNDLRPAVRRLESVPHRLELTKRADMTVIDDAYNSNPSGAKAALDTLKMMDGFRILCTPGMIELGDKQSELNRELGEYAANCCDYAVTVGKTNSYAIKEGLLAKGFDAEKIYAAEDLNDAMRQIYSLTTDGKNKIILLENDLPDNY